MADILCRTASTQRQIMVCPSLLLLHCRVAEFSIEALPEPEEGLRVLKAAGTVLFGFVKSVASMSINEESQLGAH